MFIGLSHNIRISARQHRTDEMIKISSSNHSWRTYSCPLRAVSAIGSLSKTPMIEKQVNLLRYHQNVNPACVSEYDCHSRKKTLKNYIYTRWKEE